MNSPVAPIKVWQARAETLRQQGGAQRDPATMTIIDGLLQRPPARTHGRAHQQWQQRLEQALKTLELRLQQAASASAPAASCRGRFDVLHIALAAAAAQRQPVWQSRSSLSAAPPPLALAAEPHVDQHDAISALRASQGRQQARRRLQEALNAIPENAGPLNSQRLISRALQVLNQDAPAYVELMMAHTDTLIWLQGK